MKPYTSTIQTDLLKEVMLLETGKIVAVFINALPPQGDNLHGTSIEFFFEDGESCSIDGLVIDVAPKEEAYLLHFGKAMERAMWQDRLHAGVGKSSIKTFDLHAIWNGQGLERLLVGPREVRFYKAEGRKNIGEESAFEAIQLYVPKGDDAQSIFLQASQDFPGDVAVAVGSPTSEFKLAD